MTIEAQPHSRRHTPAHRLGLWWLATLDRLESASSSPRQGLRIGRALGAFAWARSALGAIAFFATGAAFIALAVFTRDWEPAGGLLLMPLFGLLLVIAASVALPRRDAAQEPLLVGSDS